MLDVYSVATIIEAEERAFAVTAPGELMQRAARGLAVAIAKILRTAVGRVYGAEVLLVVGTGNNGGDGLFAGAWLARRGAKVRYWVVGASCHAEGEAALVAAGGRRVTEAEAYLAIAPADVVVDAVLGIGGRGGLREPVASFARACAAARVVAVDLPSGLQADSQAVPDQVFGATHTVTFGGYKMCQVAQPAKQVCGAVTLVDIGLEMSPDYRQWEVDDLSAEWPVPTATDHKYTRGVVGLDVGSAQYPGAAVLVAMGAVQAGAGMVRILADSVAGTVAGSVLTAVPNVVAAPGPVSAQVVGSGWGTRDVAARLAAALDRGVPTVIDADALRGLPEIDLGSTPTPHLLTPHAGELARLLGWSSHEVAANPVAAARSAASSYRTSVLLKGATQYLATPDGQVTLAVPGPAWTAQAGSGDVLAGVAGSLLAAGRPAATAGLAAASLQAVAAARNWGPIPPQTLASRFPGILAEVLETRATRYLD